MDLLLLVVAISFLLLVAPRLSRFIISKLLKFRKRSEKLTLQTQIVGYRRELANISQVDEFAKYSKIQRKLNKTSDQLNSIAKEDLTLNVQYVLVAQGLAWLVAVLFCFRLVYQIYSLALSYLGYRDHLSEGTVSY